MSSRRAPCAPCTPPDVPLIPPLSSSLSGAFPPSPPCPGLLPAALCSPPDPSAIAAFEPLDPPSTPQIDLLSPDSELFDLRNGSRLTARSISTLSTYSASSSELSPETEISYGGRGNAFAQMTQCAWCRKAGSRGRGRHGPVGQHLLLSPYGVSEGIAGSWKKVGVTTLKKWNGDEELHDGKERVTHDQHCIPAYRLCRICTWRPACSARCLRPSRPSPTASTASASRDSNSSGVMSTATAMTSRYSRRAVASSRQAEGPRG